MTHQRGAALQSHNRTLHMATMRGSSARSLADLPPEAVLRVCDFLSPRDILRLGCTCTALQSTLLHDDLWQRLTRQRWFHVAARGAAPRAPTWRRLFFEGNNWETSWLLSSVVRRYDDFHAIEFEPPSARSAGAPPCRHARTPLHPRVPCTKGQRVGASAESTLLTVTRAWPDNRIAVEAFQPVVDTAGICSSTRQTFRSLLPPTAEVHGVTSLDRQRVVVSVAAIGGGAALATLQHGDGALFANACLRIQMRRKIV